MEAFLIDRLNPELNVKSERIGEMEELGVVHIQNFSDVTMFMHDNFVYQKEIDNCNLIKLIRVLAPSDIEC